MDKIKYQGFSISGGDSQTFLQGQVTNDLSHLTETPQAAAYCSPEGKILGFFFISKQQESYLLLTNDPNPSTFINRLKMFVLRSDVHVEPSNLTMTLNTDSTNSFCFNGLTYAIIENTALTEKNNSWKAEECAALVPQITENTRNQILAPFYNLDLMNAISYDKGCYVGQEPIARLHFRGKTTKRCIAYRGLVTEDLALCEGEQLTLTNEEGRPVRCQLLRQGTDTPNQQIVLQLLMNVKQLHFKKMTLERNGTHLELQQLQPPFSIE